MLDIKLRCFITFEQVYFLSSSEESDDDKKQQDDSEDEETDYEPESEDVCNDEEKFIPRRRMVAPSKEATSGDAASAQDTLDQGVQKGTS